MRRRITTMLFTVASVLCVGVPLVAQASPPPGETGADVRRRVDSPAVAPSPDREAGDASGLTGSSVWKRESLTDHFFGLGRPAEGISFDVSYTADVVGNFTGGLRKRWEYLDNLDVRLTIESDPVFGLPGGTLFLYALGNSGGDPSRQNIGDAQVFSNIEAPNTFKLYEAWYDQRIADAFSIRAGLYDLNSEFDTNEVGSVFIHSSHGIGYDFAQSGVNGPSIFNTTSLAVRAAATLGGGLTLRAAALDGVAGDPGEFRRTQIILKRDDGLLVVAEADWRGEIGGFDVRLAGGTWRYTRPFDDVLDTDGGGAPKRRRGNIGAYAIFETSLYRESDPLSAPGGDREASDAEVAQGLSGFIRWGWADDRFNTVGQFGSAGLVYTGLLPGRNEDQLGIAVATAFTGPDSRRAGRRDGSPIDGSETALEVTYRVQVTPWFAVQPDVQFIFDPGFDPNLQNAIAGGIRFEIVF